MSNEARLIGEEILQGLRDEGIENTTHLTAEEQKAFATRVGNLSLLAMKDRLWARVELIQQGSKTPSSQENQKKLMRAMDAIMDMLPSSQKKAS